MLTLQATLSPIEVLLNIILQKYLLGSYCVTVISEVSLDFSFNATSYTFIVPNENLVDQLLQVSEMGCSDYVVRLREPQVFMEAFEKVNHLGNTRRSDRKIVFLPFDEIDSTEILLDVLSMRETSFVANVLLILPSTDQVPGCKTYDLVTHRYVGEDDMVDQPDYLDKWDSCAEKFENNANLFPHDMTNLQGKILKLACFTYKPYSLLDLDTTIAPFGRDGTEIRIVEEFCRWVNCTIEVIRDDEHQWGEIYENQTGVGVIGNVFEDRADLGISALYSWYEEYINLDFSAASIRTAITCIAPAPRLLASWEMPLLPFHWYMWLGLFFTFLYASIALTIAQGCSSDGAFLTTFGMMVTQSQEEAGATWRIRSITGWLLVTGLVLDNAYAAGLASTFTVPKYEQSIDTIQDIVDKGMEWGATHDAWIFSLALSPEPLIKQLVSQFRIYKAEELKQKSFTRNMAFSIEQLPAGYFAIGGYITKDAVLDMTLMLEDFYYEQCVVMMRKSSPYTAKVSDLIGRLHESGLMLAWETQMALNFLDFEVQLEVKLSRSKKDVDVESLTLRHVVGIFFIYVAGIIISSVLFVAELFVKRGKPTRI